MSHVACAMSPKSYVSHLCFTRIMSHMSHVTLAAGRPKKYTQHLGVGQIAKSLFQKSPTQIGLFLEGPQKNGALFKEPFKSRALFRKKLDNLGSLLIVATL